MRFIRLPIYILLVLVVCGRDFYHATENFDMFCYIAAAEAAAGKSVDQIFSAVQEQVRIVRADQRKILLASDYRRDLLSNPVHLALAIPFYSTKPLYVALLRGLRYLTRSYFLATFLLTVAGYLGIAAMVWLMVGRYNLVLATLIVIQPALANAVQLRTPDLLATFCLMAGFFVCAERRTTLGIVLMLTSLWVRPDLVVYVACFAAALYWAQKLDIWQLAMTIALLMVNFLTMRAFSYPWSTWLYRSFMTPMVDPTAGQFHVTPSLYLRIASHAVIDIWERFGGLLLLLTLLAAGYRRGTILLVACVAGTLLHFVMFPSSEERFYLPLFLAASILAAQRLVPAEKASITSVAIQQLAPEPQAQRM